MVKQWTKDICKVLSHSLWSENTMSTILILLGLILMAQLYFYSVVELLCSVFSCYFTLFPIVTFLNGNHGFRKLKSFYGLLKVDIFSLTFSAKWYRQVEWPIIVNCRPKCRWRKALISSPWCLVAIIAIGKIDWDNFEKKLESRIPRQFCLLPCFIAKSCGTPIPKLYLL